MAAPAPVIPRGFTGIPHAGMAEGRAQAKSPHTPMGGGGGNPLRAAQAGFDAQGQELERPYSGTFPGGLIGHALNEGVRQRNNAQLKEADDAKQQKMQAGADAYWNAFQKGGNPDQALLDAVHPDNDDGHVHLMDKDTFEGMKSIYSLVKQAQQGGLDPTEFSTKDVGNGYSVVTGPGMKPQVLKPDKTSFSTFNTDRGTFKLNHATGEIAPATTASGEQLKPAPKASDDRYHMTQDDRRFMMGGPQVLRGIDMLKDASTDAQGFIRGPAGQFFAKLAGSNDPQMIWNAAKNNLQDALIEGKVPGAYAGPLKKYLDETIPKAWHAAPFDITTLNMMGNRLRDEYTQRAAMIEADNGGRPIPNQQGLKAVGVYPPSLGWNNPRALLSAGTPEALNQLSPRDALFLADHANELSPQERQALKGITQMKSPAAQQAVQQQAVQQQQGAQMMPQQASGQAPTPQPATPQPAPGAAPTPSPVQPQDSQGAGAPIPPTAAPPPGPQSSANPLINSAQAAEPAGAAPAAQAQPQPEETSSASAPIPAGPQENADIVSQHVDDVTKLIDSTKQLLDVTQPRPGVYTPQADQLGAKKEEE